jgi:hypothetical protein
MATDKDREEARRFYDALRDINQYQVSLPHWSNLGDSLQNAIMRGLERVRARAEPPDPDAVPAGAAHGVIMQGMGEAYEAAMRLDDAPSLGVLPWEELPPSVKNVMAGTMLRRLRNVEPR